MKKRNCKKSEEERKMHEDAVKIRKMTDCQICMYIEAIKNEAYSSGFKDGKNQGQVCSNSISRFIQHLDILSGTGNGIGKTTVCKINNFAKDNGYLLDKQVD